jgi:peroxiredoxin
VTELQGLQLSLDTLRARGCAIAGVVVDPPETNAELARKAGLDYPILSDPGLHTADAYRLRHVAGAPDGQDIAHAASVLIDGAGVVRWTSVTRNLRVRPRPADVLAAIDADPSLRVAAGRAGARAGQ